MDQEAMAESIRKVLSLASLFSTCVEAFGLIHASRDTDEQQRLALTKLGIEQGRLLIFGDAVGISSPPATIATSQIPSHIAPTNPDPTLPIFFDPRDRRLDDPELRKVVEDTLNEIVDRPAAMTREQMMELYGLKPPKRPTYIQPALDIYRLEAFREKYSLLQDLSQEICGTRGHTRSRSMTAQHWAIHDVAKFSVFVKLVRDQVDKLEHHFDCKERIDKCMKTDIKTLGWHPDMSISVIKRDWEKLTLIKTACKELYPDYVMATEVALNYIDREIQEKSSQPVVVTTGPVVVKNGQAYRDKPKKRPSIFNYLRFSSFGRSRKDKDAANRPQHTRALSESAAKTTELGPDALTPARSMSNPNATPEMAVLALDPPAQESRLNREVVRPDSGMNEIDTPLVPVNTEVSGLQKATTATSLIDRHDQFQGIGRLGTREARERAHAL